jgi:hypothetical protein
MDLSLDNADGRTGVLRRPAEPGRTVAFGSLMTWAALSLAGWSTILGTALLF